jgi:hypothetical protein
VLGRLLLDIIEVGDWTTLEFIVRDKSFPSLMEAMYIMQEYNSIPFLQAVVSKILEYTLQLR